MRHLTTIVLVALLTVAGCSKEGPTGPAGPQGAQGPPGPTGAAGALNRADFTGVFGTSLGFSAPLPAASVSGGKVPAIACYVSTDGDTWLAVAFVPDDTNAPFCGITGIGTSSPALVIVNGFVGWRYYLIVMW